MAPRKKKVSLKTKRRHALYIRSALFGMLFISVVIGVWFVARLPEVTVQSVAVSGTHYTPSGLVEEVASSLLNGSYFFLVPRENALFVPSNTIVREVKSFFPAVKEVQIQRNNMTALTVLVTEREPFARWCNGVASTSRCFLMDEGGYVFTPAEDDSFRVYLGKITEDPVGKVYIEHDFEKLHSFITSVGVVTERTPSTVTVDEFDDVTVSFSEGGLLQFVLTDDHITLLDNIASVFASRRVSEGNVLEYADFRFGNKVYVKFKEE